MKNIVISGELQSEEVSTSSIEIEERTDVKGAENQIERTKDVDVKTMQEHITPPTTPEVIEVYAEAVFERSPSPSLTQDEMESLGRYVTNLEHLQRNIRNIVIDRFSTYGLSDGKFVHTANFRIFVKGENLWQSARSYLWKYLGQDSWERGNDPNISLKRIHQKN